MSDNSVKIVLFSGFFVCNGDFWQICIKTETRETGSSSCGGETSARRSHRRRRKYHDVGLTFSLPASDWSRMCPIRDHHLELQRSSQSSNLKFSSFPGKPRRTSCCVPNKLYLQEEERPLLTGPDRTGCRVHWARSGGGRWWWRTAADGEGEEEEEDEEEEEGTSGSIVFLSKPGTRNTDMLEGFLLLFTSIQQLRCVTMATRNCFYSWGRSS